MSRLINKEYIKNTQTPQTYCAQVKIGITLSDVCNHFYFLCIFDRMVFVLEAFLKVAVKWNRMKYCN